MQIDQLQADLNHVRSVVTEELEGLSSFVETIESQLDELSEDGFQTAGVINDVADRLEDVNGLAQENAVVIKAVARRYDRMFRQILDRLDKLERKS